jgi:hypothetical protein
LLFSLKKERGIAFFSKKREKLLFSSKERENLLFLKKERELAFFLKKEREIAFFSKNEKLQIPCLWLQVVTASGQPPSWLVNFVFELCVFASPLNEVHGSQKREIALIRPRKHRKLQV